MGALEKHRRLVLIAFLVLGFGYSSSVYVPLEGRPTAIDCDGSTHADDQQDADGSPSCGTWGAAILDDQLEYPQGVEAADIERLELEQALWGYVDQCTATAFVKGTTDTFEQEVTCWDDSLSEPFPD